MPIYEDKCSKCDYVNEYYSPIMTDTTKPCSKCGGETERLYSLSHPHVFEVFSTNNILPHGKTVTVKGPGQLRQLEAEHGVKRVDEPIPPQTRFNQAS